MSILNLTKASGMLNLKKAAPTLKRFRGVLNWDVHPVAKASLSQGFDLDIFAFVLDANGKITSGDDVVFFNNKKAHGLSYPRDNRTGEGADDEEIIVTLADVPATKSRIDLYVFLFDAEARRQNFGMISGGLFQVIDADTNAVIQSYKLDTFSTQTAVNIGSLERTADGWTFDPIGTGANKDADEVAGFYL